MQVEVPQTVLTEKDSSLTFFSVVPEADIDEHESTGCKRIKKQKGPDAWKVGLRAGPNGLHEAIARGKTVYGEFDKERYVVLEIKFTAPAVAYYSTLLTGADYNYVPMLQKQVYPPEYDDAGRPIWVDWGVWHFHGDLPLNAVDHLGYPLITTKFHNVW